MYQQSEKNLLNSSVSSTCPHNMMNFSPLAAEIGWQVWSTPADFNNFAQRRSTKLHSVWPSPGLEHHIYNFGLLSSNRILPGAKFTSHRSLAFSYICIVTARHLSSGCQPNCNVQQRATLIFGMAAITLGIGPHYSVFTARHKRCTSYSKSVCLSVCHTPILCQNDGT